jgi:Ca2+-binding EF-hand superfamily protein
MKGVKKYLHTTCEKRLFKSEPLEFSDLSDTALCVSTLMTTLNELKTHKEEIFEKQVLTAYNKFDKDGNGTLDLQELGQLSTLLGQPLNEE